MTQSWKTYACTYLLYGTCTAQSMTRGRQLPPRYFTELAIVYIFFLTLNA